jgi:hypothetical protein
MMAYDATEKRTLGLTDEELKDAWARTAGGGRDRYRVFARELEDTLAGRGVQPDTVPAVAVFDQVARMREWAGRTLPVLARSVALLERLGYRADEQTQAIAEYLARWGQDGLQ